MIGGIDETGNAGPTEEESLDELPVEGSPDEDGIDEDISDKDIDLTADDIIDGGSTAEIKVDALVAKIDSEDAEELARQREIRRKLDALNEGADDEFGSTYNFNLDEDL